MLRNIQRVTLFIMLMIFTGCSGSDSVPTVTPTVALSAPTLAPSPTVKVLTSDELYGDTSIGGQNNPVAAALPSGGELPPLFFGTIEPAGTQTVQIVLADGSLVTGDLYAEGDFRVPGVLLLAPDRVSWGLLPLQLHAAGLSVLVTDLPPAASDIETVLISFSELPVVDPARLAVIGADYGAGLALTGCAAYLACDALVLLSPDGRETLPGLMSSYNPRPLLIAVAEADADAYLTSLALASAASHAQLLDYTTGRGTGLLALYPDLVDKIVQWLPEQFAPN